MNNLRMPQWLTGTSLFIGLLIWLQATEESVLTASIASNPFSRLFTTISDKLEASYPLTDAEKQCWETIFQNHLSETSSIENWGTFTDLVNRSFSELGISHLKLYHLGASDFGEITALGKGFSGLKLQWIKNHWYVATIEANSPISETGMLPGDEITGIGPWELSADSSMLPMQVIQQSFYASFGPESTHFEIRGCHPDGNRFVAHSTFGSWIGKWSKPFGNLTTLPVVLDIRDKDKIRIVHFNYFVFDILPALRESIETAPVDGGIIIDIRGNPGGIGIIANALAGLLTDHAFQLGTMTMKDGWIGFFADPQPLSFKGPVAILIDEFSASTSEIFAQGMKESGRARLFGRNSMGAALPSKFEHLSPDFLLQLPVAKYISEKGITIENQGVSPDVLIGVTREDLIRGIDPVLHAAMEWLLATISIREEK